MKRLKERANRQHPTTGFAKLRARVESLPQPMEGKRREAFEALVCRDAMKLSGACSIAPLQAVDELRAAVRDGILGQEALAADRQLLEEVLEHLSIDHLYGRLKLKRMPETEPAFADAKVLTPPALLGRGKFNMAFSVKLANPDGSAFDGVFKPLRRKARGGVSEASGIPENDPQTAMRNIATVSYAKKLGFDVIVDTRVALLDVGAGPVKPVLGLMMEKARGLPAAKLPASVLNDPQMCAEITKLQWLDHLTGQGDRHLNNYFVHVHRDGRARVTGIDNDQCFGHKLTDPDGIRKVRGERSRSVFRGTGLPPVVDTAMAQAIERLKEDDIRSMLQGKLTEAEVDAALQRYRGVRRHIAQLRVQRRVIAPDAWNQPRVQALLTRDNSYVGRQRYRAEIRDAKRENVSSFSDS